jgi:D-alanine--D-alanine ligase
MRTVVGVLRGGPSSEYEVSLRSGAGVLEHLDRERYDARDIFIDRAGVWHVRGVPASPDRALAGVDVAFNALHGSFGKSGQLQRFLDTLGIAYTGPGPFESALAYNRHLTRQEAQKLKVKIPHGTLVDPAGDIDRLALKIFRTAPLPAIVKPAAGGATIRVDYFHALAPAIRQAAQAGDKVLVEEFINGREATVGVIDNFRNEPVYALIPLPADLSHAVKSELTAAAKQVHQGFGLAHYSLMHFIVTPRRGIYFLSAEALPELHEDSVLRAGLETVGAPFPHFLDHVIQLARND